jgi:hypothetical protein
MVKGLTSLPSIVRGNVHLSLLNIDDEWTRDYGVLGLKNDLTKMIFARLEYQCQS